MALNKIICSLILFVAAFNKSTEAIRCYYCNSPNNSACLDVNQYDEELRSRIIPVVHCESAISSPVSVNFFCRKIVQTIFYSKTKSEVRVTRGCGWVRHHKECYRADNQDHLETACQCFTDHCNTGSIHTLSLTALLVSFVAILIKF